MTPRFICFDLDGTLYLDSCVYLRMITHFFHDTPYKNWILPVQEQMKRVLSGQSALRCGQFVPKQKADHPQTPDDLFDVPGTAALTLSDPSPWLHPAALFLYFRWLHPWNVSGPPDRLGRRRLLAKIPSGTKGSD